MIEGMRRLKRTSNGELGIAVCLTVQLGADFPKAQKLLQDFQVQCYGL